MALVALGGVPIAPIGAAGRMGISPSAAAVTTTLDAAKESCMMIGQIFTADGSSHTIDTTGSSSMGFRTGAVTFASGTTIVKVGIGAVDAAAGPPGRAVNAVDVITMDVSRSSTGGGGGITANAWHEHVPTAGTKTIANGDFVAFSVQMTARGGADSVLVTHSSSVEAAVPVMPFVTNFIAAAYTAAVSLPNAVITFSDGVLGFFFGGWVATTFANATVWNNSSSPNEYGNLLQLPVPARIYGIYGSASISGNCDLVLYSDPLGTPVAEKTVSLDLNSVGVASTNRPIYTLFAAPYAAYANQPLAAIWKPSSATNVTANYISLNAATHQASYTGASGYAVSRASGAFAAVNSSKDRYHIGLLVGAFEHGSRPTYTVGF